MRILNEALLDKGYEYKLNLEKQFDTAIINVEKEMAHWYQRFAKNNDIGLAEAKRLLNTKELEEFRWSVEDYISKGESLDPKWLKQLENASTRVHISRLDTLKLQMQQQVESLYSSQLGGVGKVLRNIYEQGYYRNIFEVQKGVGIGTSFQKLNDNLISKALARPWTTDGRTFSDRIWTNKASLVNTVNNRITQMLIRGEAPDKAISEISKQFNVSKNRAGALVMTESAAFSVEAQKDCYEELDIEKYKIVESLDTHTCAICGAMDGKVVAFKDFAVGTTAPPFHTRCRGTTCPYYEDMEGIGERWARDADGKSYKVPNDMTYEQWREKYVDKPDIDLTNEMSSEQKKAYLTAVEREPKITNDLQKITDEVGGELVGLDFRLKTPESFARKISTDMMETGEPENSIISKIYDTIRYTNVSTPEKLVEIYGGTVEKFEKLGYHLNRVKNTWCIPNASYKGVNAVFQSPLGDNFELQFHTTESFALKQGNLHKLYEERRLTSTSQQRKSELDNIMVELSSKLKIPKNIDKIK